MLVQMGLSNIVILFLLARRLPRLRTWRVLGSAACCAVASFVAAACAWATATTVDAWPAVVQLALGGSVGSAVYFALLVRIDRDMAVSLLEMCGLRSIVVRVVGKKSFSYLAAGDVAGEARP
jgi:hypothetical protein